MGNTKKIRIAIAGGLHRTALATHLLGNWHIHNAPPKIMENTPSKSITILSSTSTELNDSISFDAKI